LKVIAAEFVTSAAAGGSQEGIPRDGLPQVAFAGRSNVGKSALINALCRRQVARTSAAPGKTRLANVYRVVVERARGAREALYLIDLPGYGYARGGSDSAKELAAVAEGYMSAQGAVGSRIPHPGTRALLAVDSRHPGLESDQQAFEWLRTHGLEPLIVATKIDKLTRAERVKNLRELERLFGTAALPVSAERGEGLDELWKRLVRTAPPLKERR
jgi:GTP-binding protein